MALDKAKRLLGFQERRRGPAQRSTMSGSRQRVTRPVTRRTAAFGFSMILVLARQRIGQI